MGEGFLHIAVGVLTDSKGRILISQRKPDCAFAGQWEFPGGKVERGESVKQALVRELDEELGLLINDARPLISIKYVYPDRRVMLDTWQVTQWAGQAQSREGQRFAWVTPEALDDYEMLEANRPIVKSAQLPTAYLITPDCESDVSVFLSGLEQSLKSGIRMVRLRQSKIRGDEYKRLAIKCQDICSQYGAELLVDLVGLSIELGVGLHLNSFELSFCKQRPIARKLRFAASCHNATELEKAAAIGCDFAVLGPVTETPSHPDSPVLSWSGFNELAANAELPVFALGGMTREYLDTAWQKGAQGVAAIRGLWMADRQ